MKKTTPSCILYNGECTTITEAFKLMIAQYKEEQQWIHQKYLPTFPENGRDGLEELERSIYKVRCCQVQYTETILIAARLLFTQWQDSDDEEISRLGTAALAEDYSLLAL